MLVSFDSYLGCVKKSCIKGLLAHLRHTLPYTGSSQQLLSGRKDLQGDWPELTIDPAARRSPFRITPSASGDTPNADELREKEGRPNYGNPYASIETIAGQVGSVECEKYVARYLKSTGRLRGPASDDVGCAPTRVSRYRVSNEAVCCRLPQGWDHACR